MGSCDFPTEDIIGAHNFDFAFKFLQKGASGLRCRIFGRPFFDSPKFTGGNCPLCIPPPPAVTPLPSTVRIDHCVTDGATDTSSSSNETMSRRCAAAAAPGVIRDLHPGL